MTMTTPVTKYYEFGGRRIAMSTTPTGGTPTRRYLASDHLGGTSIVMDASGNQVSRTRYLPYGQQWTHESGASPTDKLFTGHQREGQISGLYFAQARFYSADLGRFLSADLFVSPMDPQSLNRYAYALNSPVTFADPTGYWPCPLCGEIKDAIGTAVDAVSQGAKTGWSSSRWAAGQATAAARKGGVATVNALRVAHRQAVVPVAQAVVSGATIVAGSATATAEFVADYASDKSQDVGTYAALQRAAPQSTLQNTAALGISLLSVGNRRQGEYGFALYENCVGACQIGGLFLGSNLAYTPGYIGFNPSGGAGLDDDEFIHENQHHLQSLTTGPGYLIGGWAGEIIFGPDSGPYESDALRAESEQRLHTPFIP